MQLKSSHKICITMGQCQCAGDEPHREEFTLTSSYVYVAGALIIFRGWHATPATAKNRIIFIR